MALFGRVGEQTVRLGFGLQCGRQCRQCSDEPHAPKAAKPLHEGKKEDGAERKNDGRKENIDRKDRRKGPLSGAGSGGCRQQRAVHKRNIRF